MPNCDQPTAYFSWEDENSRQRVIRVGNIWEDEDGDVAARQHPSVDGCALPSPLVRVLDAGQVDVGAENKKKISNYVWGRNYVTFNDYCGQPSEQAKSFAVRAQEPTGRLQWQLDRSHRVQPVHVTYMSTLAGSLTVGRRAPSRPTYS